MATVLIREKGEDTKRRRGGRVKTKAALGEADVEGVLQEGPQTLFILHLYSCLMYQRLPKRLGAGDLRFGVPLCQALDELALVTSPALTPASRHPSIPGHMLAGSWLLSVIHVLPGWGGVTGLLGLSWGLLSPVTPAAKHTRAPVRG